MPALYEEIVRLKKPHVKLRPFVPSDLDRIIEIEESSFTVGAYSRSQFEEFYRDNLEFFVAEISGKVVGYIVGYISGETGEIDSIAVDPHFRRLGIGRSLCELIIEKFREMGIKTCFLEVRTTNEPAVRLYEKIGFKIVGILKNFYADGGDAYSMRRNI
jgi:ribosomal-protein-alanine N-acetyltransferase